MFSNRANYWHIWELLADKATKAVCQTSRFISKKMLKSNAKSIQISIRLKR